MNKTSSWLAAIILALGISSVGFFIGNALITFKAQDRFVSVKGLAERIVQANQAVITMEFSYTSDELDDLYKGINLAQQQAKAFLTQQGFDDSAIQTNVVNVQDNNANSYHTNLKAKRYIAHSGVSVTSSDINRAQQTMQHTDSLVKSGVILSNARVRYTYTNLNDIKPDMLREATANAKAAADIFAKNSSSRLGEIRQASQGLFSINSANGLYDDQDPQKKIRVVTSVQYFLR
ncbi:MAG: SIMPL domain-containing protein [Gammaproteobacteria bacterium]